MYVVDRQHQFRESVQEKNVKEFDFCSNPLPRLSTKMREVLSRKAFEKLATHQDLSNAIEKVFFRSEFLKKKFLLVQYLLLLASCWMVRRFYIFSLSPPTFASLYIPITISTSRKQYIVLGLLSKKDVRDDDVARCSTEQQDCSMKLQVNVGGHLESAFSMAIQQLSGSLLMHSGAKSNILLDCFCVLRVDWQLIFR